MQLVRNDNPTIIREPPKVKEWSYWLSAQAIDRWRSAPVPEWTSADMYGMVDPTCRVTDDSTAISSPLLKTLDAGESKGSSIRAALTAWFSKLADSLDPSHSRDIHAIGDKLRQQPAILHGWIAGAAPDLVPRSDGFQAGATFALQVNLHACLRRFEESELWHEYIATLRSSGTRAAVDTLTDRIEELQAEVDQYDAARLSLLQKWHAGLQAYASCCDRLTRSRLLGTARGIAEDVSTAIAVLEAASQCHLRAQTCEAAKQFAIALQAMLLSYKQRFERIDRVMLEFQCDWCEARYRAIPRRSTTLPSSLLPLVDLDEARLRFERAVGSSIHDWHAPDSTPPVDFLGAALYDLLQPVALGFYADEMGLCLPETNYADIST